VLELVREVKLADLLGSVMDARFEASGVHHRDGMLYIVFDNYPNIAAISATLGNDPAPQLIKQRGEGIGYEDLTFQPYAKHWYCLIEASEYEPDLFHSRIETFDESFRFVESVELDFPVAGGNKGIEGLSTLRRDGEDYLLGLCEGNACKSGAAGRKPGKGRIQIFRRAPECWRHAGTVKLPASVQFTDYSSMDFRQGYLTVISQESSALWVGKVREGARRDAKDLDDLFEGDGYHFLFPRTKKGNPLYCNLEGVTWLGNRELAVVSDKAKAGKQDDRCAEKDQSVHIFKLPDGWEP
jgi:hypothetical protein